MKKGCCKNGHEFNELNSYIRKDGKGRLCKICVKENNKRKYANPEYRKYLLALQKKNYGENREERNKKNKMRWKKNKERYNKQQRDSSPIKLKKLKSEVLTHYGNGKLACVCCGVSILEFLTLDHIHGREENDRGSKQNKKVGRVLWALLKRLGFPLGYQTLCWNCNSGRQINKGVCPHKL